MMGQPSIDGDRMLTGKSAFQHSDLVVVVLLGSSIRFDNSWWLNYPLVGMYVDLKLIHALVCSTSVQGLGFFR